MFHLFCININFTSSLRDVMAFWFSRWCIGLFFGLGDGGILDLLLETRWCIGPVFWGDGGVMVL